MNAAIEEYLLPICAALAVGMLGWWAAVLAGAYSSDKRKLAARLSNDARPTDAQAMGNLSAILPEDATNVPKFLARKPYIQNLQKKMSHAFPNMTLQKFLYVDAAVGVMPAAIAGITFHNPAATLGAFAVGLWLPIMFLNMKYNSRLKKLITQLPEALDFLSRVMRAGHSLSTGLQMMATELPAPLSGEFRKAYDQHSLGQPLEESLKEMATRIDSTDFAFFVTAVLIQRQTGGDLSEVLGNIATLIRQRMRLSQSVKAKTAEGRFTGYILVCFPLALFFLCYFMNPELYGGFVANPVGQAMLGGAAALVIIGTVAIQKITTIRV